MPTNTPKAENQGRRLLEWRASRLLRFLDQNAPSSIVAAELVNVHAAAVLACGEAYFAELGKRAVAVARRRAALCQHCDNDVPVPLSHDPVCPDCDRRLDEQFKEFGDGQKGQQGT